MEAVVPRAYWVKQYYFDERGERNEVVQSFADLIAHHPKANFRARMVDGTLQDVERPEKRSHAFIDGRFQEIEAARTDEYHSLATDQVLLVKDFILEDVPAQGRAATRLVDVPAPIAGYIGRKDVANGVIDIYDHKDGGVIARVRHLAPISVAVGDTVAYGQSLGTQSNKGLGPNDGKHVHVEMDTRYHQQFESYINDLASGRLPVQAELRENVQPQPIVNDGVFRLGQSDERIRDLQRVMAAEGYRSPTGKSLDQDGVYRPSMQGALLDFQRAHGLAQTGNIDPATLRMAPPEPQRVIDIDDHFVPGRPMYQGPAAQPTAPGHPGHPDHRPLPAVMPPAVNQEERRAAMGMRDPTPAAVRAMDHHPLLLQSQAAVGYLDRSLGRAPDETSASLSASLACLARENGLTRIDHVVLSRQTDTVRQGENVFVVQGRLDDPTHLMVHMKTSAAVETPVEVSLQWLDQIDRTMAQQAQFAFQEQQSPDESQRRAMTV